jgi:hypothetical protein
MITGDGPVSKCSYRHIYKPETASDHLPTAAAELLNREHSPSAMLVDHFSAYPLQNISNRQLQQLGETLWRWNLCGRCNGHGFCSTIECPWSHSKRLSKYWAWYKNIVGAYVPELFTKEPALRTHDDLLDIIRFIKTSPDTPRVQLTKEYFAGRNGPDNLNNADMVPAATDRNRAFNIAASVLFMVHCAPLRDAADFFEDAYLPLPWRNEVSATRYIVEAFPATEHPYFDKDRPSKSLDIASMLTAKQLKKAGLRCVATSGLHNHLNFDRDEGTVQIFHRTSILKESLKADLAASDADPDSFVFRLVNPALFRFLDD